MCIQSGEFCNVIIWVDIKGMANQKQWAGNARWRGHLVLSLYTDREALSLAGSVGSKRISGLFRV